MYPTLQVGGFLMTDDYDLPPFIKAIFPEAAGAYREGASQTTGHVLESGAPGEHPPSGRGEYLLTCQGFGDGFFFLSYIFQGQQKSF
eukprot:CAMPEP_0181250402 /NCGR_PEP_ID=MMETSP1096-20121128/46297_1 /TAXON_ID=156174 ORGANISM="Chrysochromulina ericina, Strain CCMP281" /NCGR_SAMPLE_ID=MMETSP1096 /ASSEMBLY_ACC=CAM_ASM_000453 /LENGTH=86 /DNA_ID=CAMNT_0023347861 /DNA_START=15 /DNA_END=276 /DNA_ORIENTATION=-